jgi:hypothetical protein
MLIIHPFLVSNATRAWVSVRYLWICTPLESTARGPVAYQLGFHFEGATGTLQARVHAQYIIECG